jgi:hypothetical protein
MPKQLGTLTVGALVKDTTTKYYGDPIVWKVADKNHSGYPANSVTLITDKILTLKCFDGKEPSNSDSNRRSYGNNRYIYANMRRWLNSNAGAGAWYAAQHSADAPPNSANASANPYDTQAGFLNDFSSQFINALLTTTLTVARNTVTDGGGSETLTDKLFLASNTEVGLANENSIVEGAKLALFSDNASRVATPTAKAVSNGGNGTVGSGWYWWLRTPYASFSYSARYVYSDGTLYGGIACDGNRGVRPLCNLSSSILVSDTPDSDGAYTIVWNRPPNPPATITVPETIFSNQTTSIGWSAATDPDGDTVSYRMERSINGGSWTQIYSGANTTYTDSVTTAMNTLQYRVKAVDSFGAESSYTTSATRAVTHNLPPAISGVDGDLGVKSDAFSFVYTVTDPESNVTTVVEKVDGVAIRTYTAQLGTQTAATVSGTNWVKLAQGSHTLTITATDTLGGTATRTMTFTKQVNKLSVTLAEPLAAESKPARININVVAEVPAGAIFKVEACNNANDPAPEWEDATDAVLSAHAHVFTNTIKQATDWGVNVRVTIERNSAIGECYITGIGGNFE